MNAKLLYEVWETFSIWPPEYFNRSLHSILQDRATWMDERMSAALQKAVLEGNHTSVCHLQNKGTMKQVSLLIGLLEILRKTKLFNACSAYKLYIQTFCFLSVIDKIMSNIFWSGGHRRKKIGDWSKLLILPHHQSLPLLCPFPFFPDTLPSFQ